MTSDDDDDDDGTASENSKGQVRDLTHNDCLLHALFWYHVAFFRQGWKDY